MELAAREKNLIIIGVAVLVVTYLVTQMLLPAFDHVDHLETRVASKKKVSLEVRQLSRELQQNRKLSSKKRGDGKSSVKSLLPWLESQVAAFSLKDQLDQISPLFGNDREGFREKAAIRLNQVSMVQALQLIDGLESTSEIRVIRADLRRLKEPGMLSLLIEVGVL